MPKNFIHIETNPSLPELGMLFGTLCAERDQREAEGHLPDYGDGTPRDVRGCIVKITTGQWKPILWYLHGMLGGANWMHDFEGSRTWTGGFVMPDFRGKQNEFIKAGVRPRVRDAIGAMGFSTIHAGILPHNTAAIRWSESAQGMHFVGEYKDWLLVGSKPHDILIYTQREEDIEQAKRDAEARAISW